METAESEAWKKEFVRLIERSTLGKNLAECAYALKDAHLPPRIFRYRRDTIHSLEDLQNETLWLCSPDDYNDPFDCRTRISQNRVEAALVRGLVRRLFTIQFRLTELDALPSRFEPLIGESNESYTRRVVASYRDFVPGNSPIFDSALPRLSAALPSIAEEAKQKATMFRGLTKACSFTERNDSILMWSHYAGNHQGFCVEYDLSAIPEGHTFRRTLHPIVYSNMLYDSTPLVENWIDGPRGTFNPFFPLLSFVHKAKEWDYEREWRLLFVSPKPEPNHAWSAPTPSRVFVGARMGEAAKERIKKSVAQKPIEIHQMRMSDDSFVLRSERIF